MPRVRPRAGGRSAALPGRGGLTLSFAVFTLFGRLILPRVPATATGLHQVGPPVGRARAARHRDDVPAGAGTCWSGRSPGSRSPGGSPAGTADSCSDSRWAPSTCPAPGQYWPPSRWPGRPARSACARWRAHGGFCRGHGRSAARLRAGGPGSEPAARGLPASPGRLPRGQRRGDDRAGRRADVQPLRRHPADIPNYTASVGNSLEKGAAAPAAGTSVSLQNCQTAAMYGGSGTENCGPAPVFKGIQQWFNTPAASR